MRLMDRKDTAAVLVDYQTRLAPEMFEAKRTEEALIKVVKGLRALDVPIVVTTQYAKGLGHTTPELAEVLGDFEEIDKITFSCMGCEEFREKLEKTGKKTILLLGIESHCCVEQTCLELLDAGYKVYLAADCCSSRKETDYVYSVKRMGDQGAVITTAEAALFELLYSAKAPEFKAVSNIVK